MAKDKDSQNTGVELREAEVTALRDALASIPDRRKEKKPLYPIAIVITMLIYATFCDYVGASGAEKYCKLNADFFKTVFGLKGTPSVSSFRKVLAVLDSEEIKKCLIPWVKTCSPDIRKIYIRIRDANARERKEREAIQKIEMELRETEIDSLRAALSVVPDYRFARGVRYPLYVLIIMAIYSAMCGYTSSKDMETYCSAHAEYFKAKFGLKRTPSHDTFDRMKELLHPMKLALPLQMWIRNCFPDTRTRFIDMLILHIDGKAIRAASSKQEGGPPRYVLNAMYEGESIGLIIQVIGEKKNEVIEIPEYLGRYDLRNTIITADAAATSEAIINLIIAAGGHYVLPIKGNQSGTEGRIINKINEMQNTPALNPGPDIVTKYDELEHVKYTPKKEHGRLEEIVCTLINAGDILGELVEEKPFLSSATYVAVIDKKSTKVEKGVEVTTNTRRIFIVSLDKVTPSDVRKIVEGHWHIEMNHWLLDIQLREDSMTSKKGYSMEFGAMLRRLAMSLWKHNPAYPKQNFREFTIYNQANLKYIEKVLETTKVSSDPTDISLPNRAIS